jgi:cbb3-type cytochrome oxidase subunit 3
MIRLVMESANLAHWPAMSLVLFFVFSLGAVAWIYRSGSAATYRRLGYLALEDGEPIATPGSQPFSRPKENSSTSKQAAGSQEVR